MARTILDKFAIPQVAAGLLNFFFTEDDLDFIEKIEEDRFTREEVAALIGQKADAFIASAYRRGILTLEDETSGLYKLGSFYGMLDVFSISETEKYRSLPRNTRAQLDAWYFDEYYSSLEQEPSVRPTQDEILLLEDVLKFIDAQDRPVYLNYCDCRSLNGDCALPTRTCITYKNGPNSFAHRGHSLPIDKEKAKEVVRQADRAGLMHTVNPNGICNCCGDCCYLFRGQTRRGSLGFWPKASHTASLDPDKCIGCGACTRRCHFGVFEKNSGIVSAHTENCVGCGLCASTCPAKAITMKDRNDAEQRYGQQSFDERTETCQQQ